MKKHKENKKRPSRLTGVLALSIAGIGTFASVGIYNHNMDIQRRTVNVESSLYDDCTKTISEYEKLVQKNKDYLVAVDNRNEEVASQLVPYETQRVNAVSSIDAEADFSGYTAPKYVEENSSQTVIGGIENLDKKYAPYFYCDGERNDLTTDLFYLIEVECAKYNLDPYVLVGVIMTESGGNARAKNSSSTATGLCQILRGTGKFVYEDWLGNGAGTYNHNMAYDPEINIKMGACLLGTMAQQKGLYRAIQSYRGKSDISGYCASINKYMGMCGKHLPF